MDGNDSNEILDAEENLSQALEYRNSLRRNLFDEEEEVPFDWSYHSVAMEEDLNWSVPGRGVGGARRGAGAAAAGPGRGASAAGAHLGAAGAHLGAVRVRRGRLFAGLSGHPGARLGQGCLLSSGRDCSPARQEQARGARCWARQGSWTLRWARQGPSQRTVFRYQIRRIVLYSIDDQAIDRELLELKNKLAKESCNFADEDSQVATGLIHMLSLQRRTGSYFRYEGSLTTPPCTKNVVWNILGKVRQISKEQVALLESLLPSKHSARPAQPLNGRIVQFYNPSNNTISFQM